MINSVAASGAGLSCRFPHSSARMSALLCTPAPRIHAAPTVAGAGEPGRCGSAGPAIGCRHAPPTGTSGWSPLARGLSWRHTRCAKTCLTGLVRRGNDLVMVAELAGHQKLETTRRYTLPSAADRQRAVEDLQIDY
jgi:hypothetical protein